MKRFVKSAILATTLALFATSCSDSKEEEVATSQALTGYYNIVKDIDTGAKEIFTDVSYVVEYYYGDMTSIITISGLKLPGGVSYPALKSGNLKWNADNSAWKVISTKNPEFKANNYGAGPLITDFTFSLIDRWYESNRYACSTRIRFVVDGRYEVLSVPTTNIVWGETRVVQPSSYVEDHVTNSSIYVVELNPEKSLASLTINNFSLYPDHTIAAVTIADIPYTISDDGVLKFSTDSAVAKITGSNDTKFNMAVSDLSFVIDGEVVVGAYDIVADKLTYKVSVNGK